MFRFRNLIVVAMALLMSLSISKFALSQDEPAATEETVSTPAAPLEESGAYQRNPNELVTCEEISEGMKEGAFAKGLIKELGAQGLLPPAATTMDYFKLMEKLGVVPSKGWDENGVITKEELCYMLSMKSEQCEAATCDECLSKLKKRLADILWGLGIRNVQPNTISPSGGSAF